MSSHPFSQRQSAKLGIPNRSIYRHHDDPAMGTFLILAMLSAGLMGGAVYYLAGRTSSSTEIAEETSPVQQDPPTRNTATTQPITTRKIMDAPAASSLARDNRPGSLRSPNADGSRPSLSAGFPDLNDPDAWEASWTEGLFESDGEIAARNPIDEHVFAKLTTLNLQPAPLCSDASFLRRVYIDTIGTLPTADEAQRFLDDSDPAKREKLIDELLERPEFADYWAMKWSDILRVKAEFPINLWPNAAQAYHRWIRTAIRDHLPYDQFAYELLTASGSNFRTPQVNFYRALQNQDPESIAKVVALTFLCERADAWPAERLEGLSAFFSKIGFKPTGEWKEEIVFFDSRLGRTGTRDQDVSATLPNGVAVVIPANEDPRQVFAKWLIDRRNPWFSRAVANRVWYWLMGQGIVEPVDDVRVDNPPSNPELLQFLGDDLIAADYDLRHLYRQILNSTTYQLACVPPDDAAAADHHFAYYRTRRLDAEVLIDAICQITGTTETYMSIIPEPFTFLPEQQRAIALPDGSITSSFLELFGRPPRDTGLASERNNRLTPGQALHLINSNHIRRKIREGPAIEELLSGKNDSHQICERIYLTVLSRRPNEQELHIASQLCDFSHGQRDLIWTLINSDEFLFQH